MSPKVRLCIDEKLETLGQTRYWLAEKSKTHYNVINKYYKNEVFRYDSDVLLRICLALDCKPGDIIKIVEE